MEAYFSNQKDLLNFIFYQFSTYDKPMKEAIYQSFIMAAKNSSLSKKGTAAEEYFNICLKNLMQEAPDHSFLLDFDSDYKSTIGKMLHNYTYLRNGLTLSIEESDDEYKIVNSYDKIGNSRKLIRTSYLKKEYYNKITI